MKKSHEELLDTFDNLLRGCFADRGGDEGGVEPEVCRDVAKQLVSEVERTYGKAFDLLKQSYGLAVTSGLSVESALDSLLAMGRTSTHPADVEPGGRPTALTSEEREIVKKRLGLDDGMFRTLADVGKQLGLTQERTRIRECKALEKLGVTRGMVGEHPAWHGPTEPVKNPDGSFTVIADFGREQIATGALRFKNGTTMPVDVFVNECPDDPAKPIIVTVEGGVVGNVTNIPAGIGVEIHDYDVEGCDPEAEGFDKDPDGAYYCCSVYGDFPGFGIEGAKPTALAESHICAVCEAEIVSDEECAVRDVESQRYYLCSSMCCQQFANTDSPYPGDHGYPIPDSTDRLEIEREVEKSTD